MGAENLDPLGLGRIDTRQLALVSCAVLLLLAIALIERTTAKCFRGGLYQQDQVRDALQPCVCQTSSA